MLIGDELINHTGPKETLHGGSEYQREVSVCVCKKTKDRYNTTNPLTNYVNTFIKLLLSPDYSQ